MLDGIVSVASNELPVISCQLCQSILYLKPASVPFWELETGYCQLPLCCELRILRGFAADVFATRTPKRLIDEYLLVERVARG
jgi:hypothetical protein